MQKLLLILESSLLEVDKVDPLKMIVSNVMSTMLRMRGVRNNNE
jgi:hypothetical protein